MTTLAVAVQDPPWGDPSSPRLWNLQVKQVEGLNQCLVGKVRAANFGEEDVTGTLRREGRGTP